MRIWGTFAAAIMMAPRRTMTLLRAQGEMRGGALAVWCFALVAVCAASVVLRAESGAWGLAHAAETASAQGTDLNVPDSPADTPSDGTPTTPGTPDGGTTPGSDTNAGPSTYTLTVLTDGTSTGIVNQNPTGGPVRPAKSTVTLTATPAATAEFAGWAGACTGTALTCVVTVDANKTVTATFNIRTTKLTVTAALGTSTGGGTVSGVNTGGITGPGAPPSQTCDLACTWTYPFGAFTRVTLTATPAQGYLFKGWSGANCTGTTATTCAAVFEADTAVIALFAPILRVGAVFSSAQQSSRSFLRFYNTGTTAATASVTVYNPTTGQSLGQWTTPTIPAGAAPQYFIGDVEAGIGMGPASAKPDYYDIAVNAPMNGYFQHVLWRSSDQTLTNLSTCGSGVTIDGARLANVHASTFDSSYPSSIVVNNSGSAATGVVLGIYNASTNVRLGTYSILSIPVNGRVVVRMREIESAADITPSASVPHYIVKAESLPVFTGLLQHLVSNVAAGVITDMTTACSLAGNPAVTIASTLYPSLIFSTAETGSQSFLRLYNSGTTAGTATVTLYDYTSGQSLGQWTSPSVPGGAEQQYFIGDIESVLPAGATKPTYYAASVEAKFSGNLQHVLWRSSNGTLTNLSTCAAAVTADPMKLAGVHSSLLNADYPSQVVINNTGTTTLNGPLLSLYDARNGTRLGTYTATSIAPNSQAVVPIATFETQAGVTPGEGMYHYVIKADVPFTGFLQHLVLNTKAGVVTDMTTACGLRATGAPAS